MYEYTRHEKERLIRAFTQINDEIGLQEEDPRKRCAAAIMLRNMRDDMLDHPDVEIVYFEGMLRALEFLYLNIHQPVDTIKQFCWNAYFKAHFFEMEEEDA